MTPSTLISIIRERYNAVNDSFFSDIMLYNALYQAQMQLALECNLIENTYTTTSTAGERNYAYPSTAISIRRVEYKGVKVCPVALIEDPKTSTTEPTGTPGEYAIWDNEIIFFATPDTDGDEIKVFSYDMPSEVSATSVLSVPAQYHMSLTDFVIALMFEKEQNDKMANYHRTLWERAVNRIKRQRAIAKRGDSYAVVRDYADSPSHPGITR